MIIENIHDDPRVFVITLHQPESAPACDGMGVGKGINITMDQDPFPHQFRKMHIILSLHVITHEVPYNDLLIAPRKICVGKKIHLAVRELCAARYSKPVKSYVYQTKLVPIHTLKNINNNKKPAI
jgi:hypothetical protein